MLWYLNAEGESDCEIVVASDEEQEIVKAIREEITQMVIVEMKDELELLDKYVLWKVIKCLSYAKYVKYLENVIVLFILVFYYAPLLNI